jgi:hypothetical protein
MTLDGVFVVGLSLLAAAASPDSATLAAGVSLAMRYMAEIVLGPPGGSLAERLGAKRALIAVSLVSAVAYAAIGSGAVWIGVIAVVLLRGVAAPLPALVAAIANPGAVRVPAIAGWQPGATSAPRSGRSSPGSPCRWRRWRSISALPYCWGWRRSLSRCLRPPHGVEAAEPSQGAIAAHDPSRY